MPCHRKKRKKKRSRRRNPVNSELRSMGSMVGKTTKLVTGVAVLGVTTNAVTSLLKK